MSEFPIRKAPLPAKRDRTRYPISKLKVGECFDVPGAQTLNVRFAATQYKRRHPGWNYTSRSQPDGTLRLWRIA